MVDNMPNNAPQPQGTHYVRAFNVRHCFRSLNRGTTEDGWTVPNVAPEYEALAPSLRGARELRRAWRRAGYVVRIVPVNASDVPHDCEARAEYERVRDCVAFNVRGAVARRRNGAATSYLFRDGSRFVVGRAGWHRYDGTNGRAYAIRTSCAVTSAPSQSGTGSNG